MEDKFNVDTGDKLIYANRGGTGRYGVSIAFRTGSEPVEELDATYTVTGE